VAENNEDRSTEDLTEEASPYRLEEFRRKGMVAQSREISGLVALLAAGLATYLMMPDIGNKTAEFMKEIFRTDLTSRMDLTDMKILSAPLVKALKIAAWVCLPICGFGFIMGALGSFAQVGSIFSTDPITPDFSKIDPIKGFKKLFSMKQALDALRIFFKVAVLFGVAYLILKSEIIRAPLLQFGEPGVFVLLLGQMSKILFLSLIMVLAVFAGFDFWMQRQEFMKNVRLTKQEAKEEYKEREGDPAIKARIRAVQREVARRRMMQAVKKADVIVTNPTHIAVALVYAKDSMSAPKVVAKGADFLAQKIKKVAADAGVPLVENVPLARTLYKTVKVGHAIPRALYQAVAEVLAYVYRLKAKKL
jgi:flagellar biosynthetic protein FlhB